MLLTQRTNLPSRSYGRGVGGTTAQGWQQRQQRALCNSGLARCSEQPLGQRCSCASTCVPEVTPRGAMKVTVLGNKVSAGLRDGHALLGRGKGWSMDGSAPFQWLHSKKKRYRHRGGHVTLKTEVGGMLPVARVPGRIFLLSFYRTVFCSLLFICLFLARPTTPSNPPLSVS